MSSVGKCAREGLTRSRGRRRRGSESSCKKSCSPERPLWPLTAAVALRHSPHELFYSLTLTLPALLIQLGPFKGRKKDSLRKAAA